MGFAPTSAAVCFCKQPVVGHPRISCAEMSLYAQLRPIFKFLLNICSRSFGLQPERVAAQIYAITARMFRKQEPFAVVFQRIAFIHRDGKILARLKLDIAHAASSKGVRSRRINLSARSQSRSSTRSIRLQVQPASGPERLRATGQRSKECDETSPSHTSARRVEDILLPAPIPLSFETETARPQLDRSSP